jgi:hypothetical protein
MKYDKALSHSSASPLCMIDTTYDAIHWNIPEGTAVLRSPLSHLQVDPVVKFVNFWHQGS